MTAKSSKKESKKDSLKKQRKDDKKKDKEEKGGPRTGAKANKLLIEDLKRKIDECISRPEFDSTQSDLARAMASVTVFRTQIKIFEKKFMSDRSHDSRVLNSSDLVKKASEAFKKQEEASNPNSNMSMTIIAASNMKKKIE